MNETLELVRNYFEQPLLRVAAIVGLFFILALFFKLVIVKVVAFATRKTKTDLDDQLIALIGRPIFVSVLLIGFALATHEVELSERVLYFLLGIIKSVAVIVWGVAGMRFGALAMEGLARMTNKFDVVQPSTLPLFQILTKLVVISAVAYFAFLSWDIDVTGWLASAGVVGIAVGFAAKDTIANLFAGVFILTDAPYKVGDYIVLDKGERGEVTQIGIRSTRILTRDGIEVTIPNASIANGRIVNETSGPSVQRRLRIGVSVAYGTDVEKAKEILLTCAEGVQYVVDTPPARVRFVSFGDSGLNLQLRAWVSEPVYKGRATDALNTKVYNALNDAGIEIPYPKLDMYMKESPKN
jgi:MscS family membrane protein